jgi:putative membrane protein
MNISRSVLFLALASITHGVPAGEPEDSFPEPTVFVEQAAQTGLTEIEAAKVALARSQDPGIRSFAQRMVKDHGKSNIELATLAAAKGIDAPSKLDAEHQSMLDDITSKSGPDFDRSYSEHMHMGHTKAVALYEAAANSPDAAVSGFAKKALPTLREHKQLAEKLPGATVKGPSAGGR